MSNRVRIVFLMLLTAAALGLLLKHPRPSWLPVGLIAAIGASAGFTLGNNTLITRAKVNLCAKGFDTASMEPTQERTFIVPMAPAVTFSLCKHALETLPRTRLIRADAARSDIEARVGMSWKSFGETLNVTVSPDTNGSSQVRVRSRPRFIVTTVDYGKGVENVETFARQMQKAATLDA